MRRFEQLLRPCRLGLLATGMLLGMLLDGPTAAQAQSMSEALAHTYLTNPSIRAIRAELRAVNEGVPQALGNYRPFIAVDSAAGGAHREVQDPTNNSEGRGSFETELSVVQPLYRGGRTVAAVEGAKAEVQAERAFLKTVEQDVLFEAARAYLDVWRDQSVVKLSINNEEVLRRQLEASQDRFEVGEITLTDVAQSESRLAGATADRIAAEGDLTASQAEFQRVVGLVSGTLERPPPVQELPNSQEDTIRRALENDPRVISAQFAERAAKKAVRETEGEFYPEVNLRGSLRHQNNAAIDNSQSQEAQFLAEVRIPIYQQGIVSSRTREAKQVASQRRLEIDEALRQAQGDAIRAWEALQTSGAQIASFESAVRSSEIALEGVRQENAVGARTILDILDAEQEFLDAQVSLVGVTRDDLVARYAVLSVIGRLTAADIGLPVSIYDLDTDYKAVRDKWFGTDAPGAQ